MADRKVFYIRHNWKKTEEPDYQKATDHLFENRQIGVHFDNYQYNIEKYKKGSDQTSISYMKKCITEEEDILIVASYLGKDKVYISNPVKDSLDNVSKTINQIGKLEIKFLQLSVDNLQEVTIKQFPMPFLSAPPLSTFVQWDMGKIAVNEFYDARIRKSGPPKILSGMYSSGQLEVLCEEYLKVTEKGTIVRKLFKTGGGMKDYDIVGIDKHGEYIGAQVKFNCSDKEINRFINNIELIENPNNKYFFTSCKDSEGKPKKGKYFQDGKSLNPTQVISLETVIDYFLEKDRQFLYKLAFGNDLQQFENQ